MYLVWPDVSEHNGVSIDDSYTPHWFSYRACDGTYPDKLFRANDAWITAHPKRLAGYSVYVVWPPSESSVSWQETVRTLTAMLGNKHRPKLTIMQDVEIWGRAEYHKDFSLPLEQMRRALVMYLNDLRPKWQRRYPLKYWFRRADNLRVFGYGNRGDLETMARGVKWRNLILADYSNPNASYRNNVAQQITDKGHCAPFGTCDMNRARMSPARFARKMGLGTLRYKQP